VTTSEDDFIDSLPPDSLATKDAGDSFGDIVDAQLDAMGIPRLEPAIKGVYDSVSADDPARAAKVMDLSRRMNQPMSFVDKNLQMIEPSVNAPDAAYWKDFEKNYPGSTKFLMNPQNMVATHDDAGNLAQHERIIKRVKDAWTFEKSAFESGSLQEELAFLSLAKMKGETTVPSRWTDIRLGRTVSEMQGATSTNVDERIGQVRQKMAELEKNRPQGSALLKRGIFGATEFLPMLADTPLTGAKYGLVAAAPVAAAGLLAGPAAPVAEAMTVPTAFGAGFAVGSAKYNFDLMTGMAYDQFSLMKDENGNPLPEDVKAIAATAAGAATAGLSFIKASAILKTIPGGDKFIQKFVSSVPSKVLESKTFGSALKTFVQRWATSTAHGVGAMEGITAINLAAGEAAKAASGQPFAPLTGQEALQSVGTTAVDALLTFGTMALPGTAASFVGDVGALRRSAQAKQVYEAMGATAEASKLRERLPEAHKAYVESVTKGTPVENIHIPADAFETYFQSKKIDPAKVADELGVRDSFDQAKEAGSDVEIPLATWTDKMLKTEHYKALADDIKFHPDDMTQRQIRDMAESTTKALEGEAEKAVAEDKDLLPGKEAVYADIKGQLLDAGRPEPEAKAGAQLWANRAVVEARRRGITPEEWYGSRLRVTSEAAPTRLKIPRADIEAFAQGLHSQATEEFRTASETADRWKDLIGPGLQPPSVVSGSLDVMGEYKRLPLWMKNREGRPMDEVEADARAQGLLTEGEDFFSKLEKFKSPETPGRPSDYFEEARRQLEGERRLSQEAIPDRSGPARAVFLGYNPPFSDFPARPLYNING
jgi:hypothetical protein